jgi:6-phosphogluconate dehydrogenase
LGFIDKILFLPKIKVGPSGSGHFVKMVHNGIEYGDMQLIGEVYHMMKDILKMSNDEIAAV